jgi:hypothetical protein
MQDGSQNKHPRTLAEAVFTKGVVDAIAYAINHPGVVADLGSDEYNHLMDVFQDFIPQELIDHNQWWSCHYLSNGRKCNGCLEIAKTPPCDEPEEVAHLLTNAQCMISHHAADCSVRNGSTFEGLMVCESLNFPNKMYTTSVVG